ncbi:hypothetical protein FOCC_FOCC014150, partial [Frankliniella occidentalis]
MIASYVKDNHRSRDKNLHQFANAINSACHEATGFTLREILFGSDWKNNARYCKTTRQSLREKKVHYNLRRRYAVYKPGGTVYRATHLQSAVKYFSKKLAPKYDGPFEVVDRDHMQGYLIKGKGGKVE